MKLSAMYCMIILALLFLSGKASACPRGQYEKCVFRACVCLPNGGTVVRAVNPLPDTITTVKGVVQGDAKLLSQGVGGLVMKGTCTGCSYFAETALTGEEKQLVQELVGRGTLLFYTGVDPVIIIADAASTLVQRIDLKPPKQALAQEVKKGRAKKIYTSDSAICAVISEKNAASIGWADAPILTDKASGTKYTFPGVDLAKGDEIIVTSSGECTKVPKGQQTVKNIRLIYEYSSLVPGDAKQMKYFLNGTHAA